MKSLSEKQGNFGERKRWLWRMGEGEMSLEKKMVARDEICWRK